MDSRLVAAARTGSVDYLLHLIREDSLLLNTVALSSVETPLHIASMCGHLPFVQEMLKLMIGFAYELNQDGFTPLHLASACGHLEIVRELLKADHNLCTIHGRDQRLAVHCAVVKGRVDVVKELLSASPDSVQSKTARGETLLHLAVKNNQFAALKLLVEHVKMFHKEQILNEKDNQGNTILHVAASRKQYQVVRLLLVDDHVVKEAIEVNCLNEGGMTALDVLVLLESEAGDLEIHTALLEAGAKRGKDMSSSVITHKNQVPTSNTSTMQSVTPLEITNDNQLPKATSTKQSFLPARIRWWPIKEEFAKLFGYDTKRDSPNDVRSAMLTVATLFATATYQAVLSPPGGLWQEDNKSEQIIAGKSVMASKNIGSYIVFMISNSIALSASLHMIYFWTSGFPMRSLLLLSLVPVYATYSTSLYGISPDNLTGTFAIVLISLGWLPVVLNVVRILYDRVRRLPSQNPIP